MSVKLRWDGLDSLKDALRHAPESVRHDADRAVRDAAAFVARDVQEHYPEGPTGNLKRGVTVQHNSSQFGTVGIVRSRAKHASIFEKGTARRQTNLGRNRGAMPQPPEAQRAIPKFVRARQRMVEGLIEVVRRAGFDVEVA